jgi:hypothetical protein
MLPPALHASLVRLATARSEPVDSIVHQICEWLVEAEDERAEWPIALAVEFYIINYIGPV